ncbi:MAG TPA: ABC transporter ATP-binding protein [Bryobacteraceae bacterium]|jgi:lipopolysaccharide transport system ATP-binding protein
MNLISVNGLTKQYPLVTRSGAKETFLALDDVSFELAGGEVLGVLGGNGAGKSTLLKILSRVIRPTSGRATLRGRVGSLLEVGVGFHPDLTGRENVFLSAAILGLKDREIRACFDAIVDFSGVEAFLETPVRVYSSGMYMRLAFAVAAHLQPEILLIDEVLAVGDANFQKKCLERLRKLGQDGQGVLFVSHNTAAIARLCTRAVLLDHGKLVCQGSVPDVMANYLLGDSTYPGERSWGSMDAPGDAVARLIRIRVRDEFGQTRSSVAVGEAFDVDMEFEVFAEDVTLFPSVTINNEWGTAVLWSTDSATANHGRPRRAGFYRASVRIPRDLLAEGTMTVTAAMTSLAPKQEHFCAPDAVRFLVTDRVDGSTSRGVYTDYINAVVRPKLDWCVEYDPSAPISS